MNAVNDHKMMKLKNHDNLIINIQRSGSTKNHYRPCIKCSPCIFVQKKNVFRLKSYVDDCLSEGTNETIKKIGYLFIPQSIPGHYRIFTKNCSDTIEFVFEK